MNPTFDFEGQVALVTGAGSGIGLAAAEAFAQAGAAVVLVGHKEQPIDAAAHQLAEAGHKAIAVTCDVADEKQAAATVERAVSTFGRLDPVYHVL